MLAKAKQATEQAARLALVEADRERIRSERDRYRRDRADAEVERNEFGAQLDPLRAEVDSLRAALSTARAEAYREGFEVAERMAKLTEPGHLATARADVRAEVLGRVAGVVQKMCDSSSTTYYTRREVAHDIKADLTREFGAEWPAGEGTK